MLSTDLAEYDALIIKFPYIDRVTNKETISRTDRSLEPQHSPECKMRGIISLVVEFQDAKLELLQSGN